MCRLQNMAMHDYQESVITRQTDRRTNKVIPMCRYALQATQQIMYSFSDFLDYTKLALFSEFIHSVEEMKSRHS